MTIVVTADVVVNINHMNGIKNDTRPASLMLTLTIRHGIVQTDKSVCIYNFINYNYTI